jgi:hypothetical protein
MQEIRLGVEGAFPPLRGATEWLNSEPLTAAELGGRVVVVEFLTYTCINWLRQLPYLRAWSETYADQGLVALGVHTPEFSFEKKLENVRRAMADMRVDFPIAVDNDYAVWTAFDNNYWPALYFIDATGQIRHHRFGEGGYEESERIIQQLLDEAGGATAGGDVVSVDGSGAEAAADWESLQSSENYLGYLRTENFASPGGAVLDEHRDYALPADLRLNHWAIAGDWTVGREAAELNEPDGRVAYRFHARDVHLVMGPPDRDAPVRFNVLIDGQPAGPDRGADVDEKSSGIAREQRLYQLVRQRGHVEDRTLEVVFLDAGVEAYAFTFG